MTPSPPAECEACSPTYEEAVRRLQVVLEGGRSETLARHHALLAERTRERDEALRLLKDASFNHHLNGSHPQRFENCEAKSCQEARRALSRKEEGA